MNASHVDLQMAAEQGTGATAAEAMEQSSERTSWFKIYAIAQHPVRILQVQRDLLLSFVLAERFNAHTLTYIFAGR